MKKVVVWVVVLMLVFTNTGFALDFGDALGDAFGGLTAMFAPNAEDAHLPGEVVELDDLNITLTNVYESKGNDMYTPAEGMEYMMIEFDNADVDEPFRVYLELDENGTTLLRKVESYRAGLQEVYRNLNISVNVYELAGEDGEVLNITASQFESLWSMAHEMSGGIMGTSEFFF